MTLQVLLNLLIGLIWMLLNDAWSFGAFAVGYLVGTGIIFAMRRFFPAPFYGRKALAVLHLFLLFIVELVKSTFVVIRQVLRPRLNIRPGVFRMETPLRSDFEITLLAALITLTPGSVVMEVAPQEGVMYVHAMDADEFHGSIMESKRKFERAILEVTR